MLAAPGIDRKYSFSYRRELVRKRRARRFMARRVAPDEPFNVYTLGYNTITAIRAPETFAEFSGSSLNRKKYDKRKIKVVEKETTCQCKAAGYRLRYCEVCDGEASGYVDAGDRSEFAFHERGEMRTNVLAKRSRGKIRDKFAAFFAASKGRNTFCTLTFISEIKDREAVKVLNKFFTAVRAEFPELNYIWVAERQKKNKDFPDNIHFHIIMDRRLPIDYYNSLWVLQQYNSGLTGRSSAFINARGKYQAKGKVKREISKEEIEAAYKAGAVRKYFNPMDIRPVDSMDVLAGYLTKYVTKNEDSFGCLAWHCSRKVSVLITKRRAAKKTFDEAGDPNINFSIDTRDGSRKFSKTYEVFTERDINDPKKKIGSLVCLVRYINNRKHFHDHMKVVTAINSWILYGKDFSPDITIMDVNMYASKYHNLTGFY